MKKTKTVKTDLATTIIAAIVGVIVAYLIINIIMKDPAPVTIKSPVSLVNSDVGEPDPEVFNYRALNPTVEVYVGNECQNYDASGICLDEITGENGSGNSN